MVLENYQGKGRVRLLKIHEIFKEEVVSVGFGGLVVWLRKMVSIFFVEKMQILKSRRRETKKKGSGRFVEDDLEEVSLSCFFRYLPLFNICVRNDTLWIHHPHEKGQRYIMDSSAT